MGKWTWPKALSFPAVVQRVSTNSALNALLWLAGLCLIASVVLGVFGSPLMWLFGILTVAVVGYVLRSYEFFMKNDPNRLHSEKFQLNHQKNRLLMDERAGANKDIIDLTPMANTHVQAETAKIAPGEQNV